MLRSRALGAQFDMQRAGAETVSENTLDTGTTPLQAISVEGRGENRAAKSCQYRRAALLLVVLAVLIALAVLLDMQNAGTKTASKDKVDIGNATLRVMSFNLEGRGGNQVDEYGRHRRAALLEYLGSLCSNPDGAISVEGRGENRAV